MNGYRIAALCFIAFEALVSVATVGKDRKPRTPADAVGALIEWGILAWLVIA